MALKQYKAAGVEYSMISDFFANALSEADLSRPAEYIAREILVKDNQELKKSNKCYDQVINTIERRRKLDLSAISEAIDDLVSAAQK